MCLAPLRRPLMLVAIVVALSASACMGAPAPAEDVPRHGCLKQQYAEFSAAQRDLQEITAVLVVKLDSSLREVARVAKNEQIAQIDALQRAFEAQLDTAPERLRLDQSVNGWLSLPSPPLAELEARGIAPRSIVSKHPDWPRLKQLLASDRIVHLPEFEGPAVRALRAARETSRCP